MILSIALALAGPHGLPDDCGVTHRYRFATIEDPYHCLRARTDATRRWLEAESARATSALPAPVIDALVAELTPLLRTGAPAVQRSSGRWYAEDPSTRHLLSWTDPATPAIAAELSSLDPAGHLGQVSATPTGVLFTWDADGDEVYDLYAAGPTGRPARLTEGVADAFAVVDDGILLVRHDATFRPNRVVLRTGARERTTHIEPDARFYLTISPGREPTLVAESATTTEIRLGTPRFPAPLLSRRAGANYLSQDLFLAVDHTPALFSTFDARKSPGWERALGELPSVPLPRIVGQLTAIRVILLLRGKVSEHRILGKHQLQRLQKPTPFAPLLPAVVPNVKTQLRSIFELLENHRHLIELVLDL